MDFAFKKRYDVNDLLHIVSILRMPGGCPWDAAQTHSSIRKNLIEETYEVAEAIDLDDTALLCEELGDLLLQVVLHTCMEQEEQQFDFNDVCDGICKKLIFRHPHVFKSEGELLTSGQVLQNWEVLKNAEKGRESVAQRLSSVPKSLPALMRSEKVQKRAEDGETGKVSKQDAVSELRNKLDRLQAAVGNEDDTTHEIGDLLFSAVNMARIVGVDAEEALSESTDRFVQKVIG